MPSRIAMLAGFVLAALTLTSGPAHAAWPNHPMVNLAITSLPAQQSSPALVSDGNGGVIVAWVDGRNGLYDIYAHHVRSSGALDPSWPTQGLAVNSDASVSQFTPRAISDGAGGALIAWDDSNNDVFVHHVLASGALDPAWPIAGRAVAPIASMQAYPRVVSDGAGGAIVVWRDDRNGNHDIFAQRVLASGSIDPAWPSNGVALTTAVGTQDSPTATADGSGGVLVAWEDWSTSPNLRVVVGRVLSSGTVHPGYPSGGQVVCAASGLRFGPRIVGDGSGGAIVAWEDQRVDSDIYAMRVLGSGAVDASWPFDGLLVCAGPAFSNQQGPELISDGAGGALITWFDLRVGSYDIYAHHVLATGTTDPSWPVNGRDLCTASGTQLLGGIVSDGQGGAFVAWRDQRSGTSDVYAQRVLASGTVDPIWPIDGRAVSTAPGDQPFLSAIASDDNGGFVLAWMDTRAGINGDIYAQRVARHAYLGTPEGEIVSVRDVPNDQGGKVKVSWNASYLDTGNDPNLAYYEIYRSVPPNLAAGLIARGERRVAELTRKKADVGANLFTTTHGIATLYWEYVGSQNALHYLPGYSFIASTTGDSLAAYNPTTAFMTVARNFSGSFYWLSYPVSGYSVDNLPPGTPSAFAGNYSSGGTHLHWAPNPEADLAHYRLYRGDNPGFVPGPGNLIATPPDTGHVATGSAGGYFKLSAVDAHENESGFALLTPGATTEVGDRVTELGFALPRPNPAYDQTSMLFTLPRGGVLSLRVYDASGRLVRTLAHGFRPAGEHRLVWDLRDRSGRRVQSGLYFVELDALDGRWTRRLIVMRS